jgi:hypothetical protein
MATSSPTAHAETKQITSPYENSFCQFQWIESIVLDIVIQDQNLAPHGPGAERAKRAASLHGENIAKRR